jgi:hypothetical protein
MKKAMTVIGKITENRKKTWWVSELVVGVILVS